MAQFIDKCELDIKNGWCELVIRNDAGRDGHIVGRVLVEGNAISWKPAKGTKYATVSLERFAAFVNSEGSWR